MGGWLNNSGIYVRVIQQWYVCIYEGDLTIIDIYLLF